MKNLCQAFSALFTIAPALAFPAMGTEAGAMQPTVAVFESHPEAFMNDSGRYEGTLIEITRILERGWQRKLKLEVTSWPRIMANAGTDRYDIAYFFRLPVLEPKVHYLGRLGCLADLYLPRAGLKVENRAALKGLRVGLLRNGAFAKSIRPGETFTRLAVADSDSMMRLLVRDRVDVIIIHSGHYTRLRRTRDRPHLFPENWRDKLGEPAVSQLYEVQVTLSRMSSYAGERKELSRIIARQRRAGLFDQAMEKYNMPFWPCAE